MNNILDMRILPPPDREEFERELKSMLDDGDLSDLARLLQKDKSLVAKQFNPWAEDRHNPFYQVVLYLWAMDAISDTHGDFALQMILRERAIWQPVAEVDPAQPQLECSIIAEGADVQRWLAQFDIDTATDRDLNTFDDECGQAIEALVDARTKARARRRVVQMNKRNGRAA